MQYIIRSIKHRVAYGVLIALLPIQAAIAGQPPLAAGSFILQNMVNNEGEYPGMGSTWSYSANGRYHGADGIKATVYLYSRENAGIPTGADSETVRIEFATALAEIRKFNEGAQRAAAPELAEIQGYSVRYAQFLIRDATGEGAAISHLLLMGLGGQFVKVRITHPSADAENYMARLTGFLADVVSGLDNKNERGVGSHRTEQCKALAEIAYWAAQSHLERSAMLELESVQKDALMANKQRDAIKRSEIDRAAAVGSSSHGNRGDGLTRIDAARKNAIVTALDLSNLCVRGESF